MISYENTGKLAKNTRDGKVGVVLREFETGQIQVLESFTQDGKKVLNTHDSWNTLELLEEPDSNTEDDMTPYIEILEEYTSQAITEDDITLYEQRLVDSIVRVVNAYKRLKRGDN